MPMYSVFFDAESARAAGAMIAAAAQRANEFPALALVWCQLVRNVQPDFLQFRHFKISAFLV